MFGFNKMALLNDLLKLYSGRLISRFGDVFMSNTSRGMQFFSLGIP